MHKFVAENRHMNQKRITEFYSGNPIVDFTEKGILESILNQKNYTFHEKEPDEKLLTFLNRIILLPEIKNSKLICISIRMSPKSIDGKMMVLQDIENFMEAYGNRYKMSYGIFLDSNIHSTNIEVGVLANYSFIDVWVGNKYLDSDLKLGILLDSVYCTHEKDCPFFQICTNTKIKNSDIGIECPWPNEIEELEGYESGCYDYLMKGNEVLRYNITKYTLGHKHATYTKTARAFCRLLGLSEAEYFEHITAKEFIDFYLPQKNTSVKYTSLRDFESFLCWIKNKDIKAVHVCGENIRNIIIYEFEKRGYEWEHYNDDGYITTVKKSQYELLIFCSFHPSSSKYYDNNKLEKYAKIFIGKLINKCSKSWG